MLLISFGSVVAMIIFMRLCSYSTPSSRAYQHPAYAPRPPLHHTAAIVVSSQPKMVRSSAVQVQTTTTAGALPREQFVPPFRLRRRRTIDPVNGVERQVEELIPASSVPLPYHRRGGGRPKQSAK